MNFQSLMNECQSPVEKDFIWIAEYDDGKIIHEFNLETKEENFFSDLEQNKIVRFGLIGRGMKFYFETFGGFFKIAGQMIEASLKTTNYLFDLTGRNEDAVTFYNTKSETITLENGSTEEKIYQYNFGYETMLNINGFTIDFTATCCITYGEPIKIIFNAINNLPTDGNVRIKKNGEIVEESYMVLEANTLNTYTYVLK